MKTRRFIVILSLLICTFLSANPTVRQLASFPSYQAHTQWNPPKMEGIWQKIIQVQQIPDEKALAAASFKTPHTVQISYKLFGIFPLKSSEVDVMPQMKLLPGGQSIGVTLQSRGVMVVGQAPVINQEGVKVYPAKEAGIEMGDSLIKIGNKEVRTEQDVANEVNLAGQKQEIVKILVEHHGQIVEKDLRPVYCTETHRYRIGLYVRDAAAGVGTLTFIDPVTNKFGALGHVINDADTNQRIEISMGQIVASNIHSIEKGRRGHPGEKIGSFDSSSAFTGSIEQNTTTGIFGVIQGKLNNPFFKQAIPVGWDSEIQEGPAKIYTVLKGEQVEEFDVKIERIMPNRTDSKNMVLKVTDPRLIEQSGGIVQGMSGSPIVQNGKLVGAVTHVFVNDSLRGYGVFIQNMLRDSGILSENKAA